MIKRTLRYLWGKKFIIIILVLVLILLPHIIAQPLQVRTTPIITSLLIDDRTDELTVTTERLKITPGATGQERETVTLTGTDLRQMLAGTSLAHCTNINFVGEPNLTLLRTLYNYQDLRANTKINGTQTLDEWLKNQYYRYPQSWA